MDRTSVVVLTLFGTRGDIQPGVALGLELQRRGHEVHLAVPPNFVEFVESAGLSAHAVGLDTAAVWHTERTRTLMQTRNPILKARLAIRTVCEGFAAFDADLIELLHGSDAQLARVDAVVTGPLGQERAYALAQASGAAFAVLRFGPFSRNGVIFAIPNVTYRLPAVVNRASWQVIDQLTWQVLRFSENGFRRRIGIAAAGVPLPVRLTRDGVLQVQAYDGVLFPGLEQEWGADKPVVGSFALPDDVRTALGESVDDRVTQWLAAGSAPVFFGFGSVPVRDTEGLVKTVAAACRSAGVRGLVSLPADTEPEATDTDDVLVTGGLDHDVVLPHCRAAVHHGGAGTTAAALRAGLPAMVCHVGADQAYWGSRLYKLGVGDSTSLRGLTVERLTAGLSRILDPDAAVRARALAAGVTAPDKAVIMAADAVEDRLADVALQSR